MRTILAILIMQIAAYVGCALFFGNWMAANWTEPQRGKYIAIAVIVGIITGAIMEDEKK